jgi:hypothetical protein
VLRRGARNNLALAMAALKVCLLLALVAAAYAVPLTNNEAAPAAEPAKEDGRDITDIIEAAVTGEEDKLGLLPRVALKLVEAGGESGKHQQPPHTSSRKCDNSDDYN